MGKKLNKTLNELRAAAATGNLLALKALDRMLFIPHHLRESNKLGKLHAAGRRQAKYLAARGNVLAGRALRA